MREKLIELLQVPIYPHEAKSPAEVVSDYLIANGVTIPVRCKDCWKSGDGLCSYQFKNVPGKDFCGDGERKDND